jgi:hypothetical protein
VLFARIDGGGSARRRAVALLVLSVATWLAWTPTPARAAPPSSRDKLLTQADLDGKTLHELTLMQAEPHARAGQVFLEWWVRSHFEKQSWYRPGRYDEKRLSDVDRKNLAMLGSYLASIPRAVLVERWEALRRRHRHAREPGASGLAFSADGRTLVSYPAPLIFGRGPMSIWDAATGERLARMAWPAKLVTRGYFATPYGQRLGTEDLWPGLLSARFVGSDLVVASEFHVLIGSPLGQQPKRGLLIGPNWNKDGSRDGGVDAACIAPDGSTLVTLNELSLKTFDLVEGRPGPVHDLGGRSPSPISLGPRCEFFDATRVLLGVEHAGDSYVFDTKTRSVTRLAVPRGMTRLAPGGELAAVWNIGAPARHVTLFDLRGTPKELTRLTGARGVTNAWFTPDGRKLLVSASGGALTLHDLRDGSRSSWRNDREFVRPGTPTREDGQNWPTLVEDARERLDRDPAADLASAITFSPDGKRAAIAFDGGYLEMRDLRSGARIPAFHGHEPWSDEELWEASLLARRLGLKLEEDWPKPPRDLSPLDHLAALDRPLPESSLEPLSRLDLRLLRNTIAARRGATFKAKTLTDVFSQAPWYKPNLAYTDALLTAADRANILAIRRREVVLGGPLVEAEAAKHTEFRIYEGMHGWRLIPQPLEPERTGSW